MRKISEKDIKANRVAGQEGYINYQNMLKTDTIGITLTTVEPNSIAPKPIHSHKERQLNFIIEADATLICGGKKTSVETGDLLIFDGWEDHSFKVTGEKKS